MNGVEIFLLFSFFSLAPVLCVFFSLPLLSRFVSLSRGLSGRDWGRRLDGNESVIIDGGVG